VKEMKLSSLSLRSLRVTGRRVMREARANSCWSVTLRRLMFCRAMSALEQM